MNQQSLTLSTGGIPENWQELPNLPAIKTSAILLPPQPAPPVGTVPHDKYERLKRYLAARIATGYQADDLRYLADEYARKLVGSETAEQLDIVATMVEIVSIELGLHTCYGGSRATPV